MCTLRVKKPLSKVARIISVTIIYDIFPMPGLKIKYHPTLNTTMQRLSNYGITVILKKDNLSV